MPVFSCIFWYVCISLLFLSVPNEAMQRVWGAGSERGGGEAAGCWEKIRSVLKGSDDLNFRFTVKRAQLLMGGCGCHLSFS